MGTLDGRVAIVVADPVDDDAAEAVHGAGCQAEVAPPGAARPDAAAARCEEGDGDEEVRRAATVQGLVHERFFGRGARRTEDEVWVGSAAARRAGRAPGAGADDRSGAATGSLKK